MADGRYIGLHARNDGSVELRKGDWIQTFTGKMFWPLDPRPAEVDPIDIAAGLAKECRYSGQCLAFYSVAEHSILMDHEARRRGHSLRERRAVLLHDASEGLGLRDIARPIKGDLTNYKTIEAGVMAVIADRFDFDWPLPKFVKELDEAIGHAETAQNMAPAPAPWRPQANTFNRSIEPMNVRLQFWNVDQAFAMFIRAMAEVGCLA